MNKLVATSLEAKFTVYDVRTQHPSKGFASLTEKVQKASTLWCVRHLPQNRDIFLTSGGSGSLYLWKYSYPDSRVKKDDAGRDMGVVGSVSLLQNVTLASQPVSSMDWNPDKVSLIPSPSLHFSLLPPSSSPFFPPSLLLFHLSSFIYLTCAKDTPLASLISSQARAWV